MVATVWKT
uniref:Uncharacterized protein n=1 Tax=Arundo donax TaxID=35708 RepID=A0A0A9B166_ARUDO